MLDCTGPFITSPGPRPSPRRPRRNRLHLDIAPPVYVISGRRLSSLFSLGARLAIGIGEAAVERAAMAHLMLTSSSSVCRAPTAGDQHPSAPVGVLNSELPRQGCRNATGKRETGVVRRRIGTVSRWNDDTRSAAVGIAGLAGRWRVGGAAPAAAPWGLLARGPGAGPARGAGPGAAAVGVLSHVNDPASPTCSPLTRSYTLHTIATVP